MSYIDAIVIVTVFIGSVFLFAWAIHYNYKEQARRAENSEHDHSPFLWHTETTTEYPKEADVDGHKQDA